MTRSSKNANTGYSEQFKPAVVLGARPLNEWANSFYANTHQESHDDNGNLMLRLNRDLSTDPELSNVIRLITPVSKCTPSFRAVEVVGKTEYSAICIDNGAYENGVYLYLIRPESGWDGKPVFYINQRVMPFARLSDLVIGKSKSGLLLVKLPDTDIIKLNVTLRPSAAGEPEFNTHKTEVLIENLPVAQQKEISSRLNFDAAESCAFIGMQLLQENGNWPSGSGDQQGKEAISSPIGHDWKRIIVAGLTSIGAVLFAFGWAREREGIRNTGSIIAISASAANAIVDVYLLWNATPDNGYQPLPQNDQ